MRVLAHIKRLDDCFGQFLARALCGCGACREIEPETLARLLGWKVTLRELALRMRCSRCGRKAAEVVAAERPTTSDKNPGARPGSLASRLRSVISVNPMERSADLYDLAVVS